MLRNGLRPWIEASPFFFPSSSCRSLPVLPSPAHPSLLGRHHAFPMFTNYRDEAGSFAASHIDLSFNAGEGSRRNIERFEYIRGLVIDFNT